MKEIKVGRIYRHYKGDYYLVENVAKDADTLKEFVVYRGLYENGPLWIRPLNEFLALLDKSLQETSGQTHRFELQEVKSVRDSFKK